MNRSDQEPSISGRWGRALLAVGVAAGIGLSGCAGPSRTDDDYAHKAVATAEQARSSVETVLVAGDGSRRHDLPSAYLSVLVGEAETDADAALSTFASVQPPSARSDRVRQRTTDAVGDAVDLLAEARIQVRRGRSLTPLLPELERSAVRLQALVDAVER